MKWKSITIISLKIFGNLIEENDDTGYSTGGTLGFVEEMSISSNREGFAVIAIYVNDSLNVN